MKPSKKKWDWNLWLVALEESKISEKAKAIGREIPRVMRRTRKALAPWELPSSPGYHDLSPLCYAGLLSLIPSCGHFVPIIDPLPRPNSIGVTQHQRFIIRQLLRGRDLRYGEPDNRWCAPGWDMKNDTFSGIHIRVDQRACRVLLKRGLIEWSGCGNWPAFTVRHYRVNMRRVHGVRGFAAASQRWIEEGIERNDPAAANPVLLRDGI